MLAAGAHAPRQLGLFAIATIAAAAASLGSCSGGASSLIPADYRSTFVMVRNCRMTTEHTAPAGHPTTITNIVVYVNSSSAAAYNANANPLPVGTVVLKEEHDDPGCNHVVAYSLGRKESAGYDPAHGDWHWQHILATGAVETDGRTPTCNTSSCHSAPACLARDFMCTEP